MSVRRIWFVDRINTRTALFSKLNFKTRLWHVSRGTPPPDEIFIIAIWEYITVLLLPLFEIFSYNNCDFQNTYFTPTILNTYFVKKCMSLAAQLYFYFLIIPNGQQTCMVTDQSCRSAVTLIFVPQILFRGFIWPYSALILFLNIMNVVVVQKVYKPYAVFSYYIPQNFLFNFPLLPLSIKRLLHPNAYIVVKPKYTYRRGYHSRYLLVSFLFRSVTYF